MFEEGQRPVFITHEPAPANISAELAVPKK